MDIAESNSAINVATCCGWLQKLSSACIFEAMQDFQRISHSCAFRPPTGAVGAFLHRSVDSRVSDSKRVATFLFYASREDGTVVPDSYRVLEYNPLTALQSTIQARVLGIENVFVVTHVMCIVAM